MTKDEFLARCANAFDAGLLTPQRITLLNAWLDFVMRFEGGRRQVVEQRAEIASLLSDVQRMREALDQASQFIVHSDGIGPRARHVKVERRDGISYEGDVRDVTRWAVTRNGDCLNRAGTWDYEPLPSDRTDDWLKEHRFDTRDEAFEAARKALSTGERGGE